MDRYSKVVIKSKSRFSLTDISEIWRYRELFLVFAWRDIKVRYRQTMLGAGWALLQPLLSMFIFTVFFGDFAKIPSGDLPYPLFVLIGLVFWGYFSGIVSASSGALIENESIVKKIYFPREIMPLSKIGANLLDFIVAFAMLLITSFYFHYYPGPLLILIVLLGLLIGTIGASGLGLFLSALNIKYRDVRYALPFFIQMMVYLTPVIYPTSIMRQEFRYLIALNPMTGVIEAARVVFRGGTAVDWNILMVSAISSVVVFILGLYYFKSTEKFFADIV